jgi:hypothetical protein
VRHHQQGLAAGIQSTPQGPQFGAVPTQCVGEHDQRRLDMVIPEG